MKTKYRIIQVRDTELRAQESQDGIGKEIETVNDGLIHDYGYLNYSLTLNQRINLAKDRLNSYIRSRKIKVHYERESSNE